MIFHLDKSSVCAVLLLNAVQSRREVVVWLCRKAHVIFLLEASIKIITLRFSKTIPFTNISSKS